MSDAQKKYLRFRVLERIEHLVLVVSFTLLCVTGLPQKYATNEISQAVIAFLGGIEMTRVIHHISAAVFLLEAVYHIVIVAYKLYIEGKKATMVPTIKDGTDAIQWFTFNLGLGKKYPKMPRYNFMEKMEYLAMLWGLLVMGLTGLMLWNPIVTTNILPGEFIPAAKAAHGGEAVLAALAIVLWHFYNVHIKHWNWGMIRGTMSHHEMVEEHGAELEEIESGKTFVPPTDEEKRRRLRVFIPSAAVTSLVLIAAVYVFLTVETTAITTVPPASANVQVYMPATATPSPVPTATSIPTATPEPVAAAEGGSGVVAGASTLVWKGEIDTLLKQNCLMCHVSTSAFSVETYESVIKAVVPGDPDASKLIMAQSKGIHPGKLSDAELQQLVDWIKGGALQESGAAAGGQTAGGQAAAGAETWSAGMEELFKTKCAACHQGGKFIATSYDEALKSIKPGDPDASPLVVLQKKGGHMGQFTEAELARVIAWIKAGAAK